VFNTTPRNRKRGRVSRNGDGHGQGHRAIRKKEEEEEAFEWKRTIESLYRGPKANALRCSTVYRIANRRVLPLDTEPPNGCP